jgi:MoaA/NifB/PqqE/SkfB family radical SAM enzyme
MLRFPLRLTADLAKARIARTTRRDSAASSVLLIRPVEQARSSSFESSSFSAEAKAGTELLSFVRDSAAPVVWIGGSDPLLHSEIAQLTRCIVGHGQNVFLETDGVLLRRRIHEFRPVSRLFLTVSLNGVEKSHDLRAACPGAFRNAVEGIRAARLCGFFTCVHARIHEDTDLNEIAALLSFANTLDADGFVISPAVDVLNAANSRAESLQQKTAEARKLIDNRWWQFFSRLAGPALTGEHISAPWEDKARPILGQESDEQEEGMKVA